MVPRLINFFYFLILLSSCALTEDYQVRQPATKLIDCKLVYTQLFKEDPDILISQQEFEKLYRNLNQTLTGNLATVFRSEWKAKENPVNAARYLDEILGFYAPELKSQLKKIPEDEEDYLREVVEVIKINKLAKVKMRDPQSPQGVTDKTFTYYTKAIKDVEGGKHQVRLRRYVREVNFEELEVGATVKGYYNGKLIELRKENNEKIKILSFNEIGFKSSKIEYSSESIEQSVEQLQKQYGKSMHLYAYPHAKDFKLEVKSIPHEIIQTESYPKLKGSNYVQKLSINLNDMGMKNLLDIQYGQLNSLERLRKLEYEAKKDPRNSAKRIKAIIDVLALGVLRDRSFLQSVGSTEYRRYAFEIQLPDLIDGKPVKIQTTFDTDIGLRNNYSIDGELLDPIDSIRKQELMTSSKADDDFHIELKIPKVLIERAQKGEGSQELHKILQIFNSYRVVNKGKFHYIKKQY